MPFSSVYASKQGAIEGPGTRDEVIGRGSAPFEPPGWESGTFGPWFLSQSHPMNLINLMRLERALSAIGLGTRDLWSLVPILGVLRGGTPLPGLNHIHLFYLMVHWSTFELACKANPCTHRLSPVPLSKAKDPLDVVPYPTHLLADPQQSEPPTVKPDLPQTTTAASR